MSRLVLAPKWPNRFVRIIRDKKGKQLDRLQFAKGSPLDLNDKQFAAVESDIGKALFFATSKGEADAKATAEYVELQKATAAEPKDDGKGE